MSQGDDLPRSFEVLLTEKGVVSVSDPLQIAILERLRGGRTRPGDLAGLMGCPSSTLHFVLDKMVESGVVVRSKPDPVAKEVYYSVAAARIVASGTPSPAGAAASEDAFKRPVEGRTGLSRVADMMEGYLAEIGLDHGQMRAMYARDLAASFKDEIGAGPLGDVMPAVKGRFAALTGYRLSVFSLSPLTVVFEGDRTMPPKMDMLALLVGQMAGNATGRPCSVASVEDFGAGDSARFKVVYGAAEPEAEPYVNTSLPQAAEPDRFMIVEIDGAAVLLGNDIQVRLVDAIYERPLCVTDVVNAVGMPRSTVTTNLLRMVEDGVASVFYAESGTPYYGLNCSILMKRVRRPGRDREQTRRAVADARGDGRFADGYMTYTLARLGELGFETDYLMVVLGARYMRVAGHDDPKNFDAYFGKMSDIAKVIGLSLSVVSIYPLTIGIASEDGDASLAPAMTFAKGMAHQGLEMASSGIFVRVSDDRPGDSRVSFKEIYPSLNATLAATAVQEGEAAPRKRTSSVRDALRKRSAKASPAPVRTFRHITGIAMVVFAAMIVILSMGTAGNENTADAEAYTLEAGSGISLIDADGYSVGSMTVDAGEAVSFYVVLDGAEEAGVVIDGVARPLSDVYEETDGAYTVALTGDLTIVEIRQVQVDAGLGVSVYDFGTSRTVEYAYSFDGYYTADEYEELAGGLWVSAAAYLIIEAEDGGYVSVPGSDGCYFATVCVSAWSGSAASAQPLPSEYVTLTLGSAAYEVDGYYVTGSLRVAADEVLTFKLLSTDGPVRITTEQRGSTSVFDMASSTRTFTASFYSDATVSYVHIGIQ